MLSKNLGITALRIPEIGMGTWSYRGGPEPLRKGLDAGALFIDTAESYGTELVVADALSGRRQSVFVATKVSSAHLRRKDVLEAADRSLGRLRTDYIDLYQLHEPNPAIPLAETLGAMEELVDAGKVRFIGVSNFSVSQLQAAQRTMRKYPIVSNQVRFNLTDRTICDNLLSFCQANQITIIAYSPLSRQFQHIVDCDPHSILNTLARSIGRTPAQVALNWCLCRENVVAIPKSNSAEHVLQNCGASGWRLTPQQVCELDEGIKHHRRSSMETYLRRLLPPFVKRTIQRLAEVAPSSVRRHIN